MGNLRWVTTQDAVTLHTFEAAYMRYLRCVTTQDAVTLHTFEAAYMRYQNMMDTCTTEEGITKSWFRCWERLQMGKHSMIMNSFGVDTRKVIARTLPNEIYAMSLTVNYALWDARDQKKFEDQYEVQLAIQAESEEPGSMELYERKVTEQRVSTIEQSIGLMRRGRSRGSLQLA